DRMRRHHRVVDDVLDQIGADRAAVHMQRDIAGAVAVEVADAIHDDSRANLADNCGGLSYVVFIFSTSNVLTPPESHDAGPASITQIRERFCTSSESILDNGGAVGCEGSAGRRRAMALRAGP